MMLMEMARPEKVKLAMLEELQFYRHMNTFKGVLVADCWANTGGPPIKVKRVDRTKGDSCKEVYRSRLVGKQFPTGENDEPFAATPPLEAMRMVISNATTGSENKCLLLVDVSRAYMYAPVSEKLYVAICDEAMGPRAQEHAGSYLSRCTERTLRRRIGSGSLRGASATWDSQGISVYVQSRRTKRGHSICTWGRLLCAGRRDHLEWLRDSLGKVWSIKSRLMGDDVDLCKDLRVRNRILRRHKGFGVAYEVDPRCVALIMKDMGVDHQIALRTPGDKAISESAADNEDDILRKNAAGTLGKKKDNMVDDDGGPCWSVTS